MYLTKDILIQVLSEAAEKGKSLGKTRLIKFLYLTEVEYCRENGERLTNLRWLFYHYGPYALELEDILAEREFEKVEIKTQDDKEVFLFRVTEPAIPYARKIEVRLSLLIKKIVGQWIDKTLGELLDYVYFETEPMQAVEKRGEVLDFSTITKATQPVVVPLKASRETQLRVNQLRQLIEPTLKRLMEQRILERDEGKDYQLAMEAWDEEMSKDFDVEALKNISLIITRLPNHPGKQGN